MGTLGVSVLLLAVEVWLVVGYMLLMDVESISVSSSELRLVDAVTHWLAHLILWMLESWDLT